MLVARSFHQQNLPICVLTSNFFESFICFLMPHLHMLKPTEMLICGVENRGRHILYLLLFVVVQYCLWGLQF